jgi:hypothetical protein
MLGGVALSEDEKKLKKIIQELLYKAGVLHTLAESEWHHFTTVYVLRNFKTQVLDQGLQGVPTGDPGAVRSSSMVSRGNLPSKSPRTARSTQRKN